MTYFLPQVQVFQDFSLAASPDIRDLPTLIAAGHAVLYRYAQAAEKNLVGLGTYDYLGANIDGEFKTCYAWPEKPSSALVDTAYTKLFIDDALLRYWYDTSHTMTKTGRNKIKHPSKNFKANGTNYPRHADFLDRDVRVGDVVRVTGSSDGGTTLYHLYTTVKAIEAVQSAALVGAATADDANADSVARTTSATAGSGNTGTVAAPSVSATAYDGLPDGDVSETYTITVTQASTGGSHPTARLRVVSASGRDDDLEVTPSAAASPTAIGDRGLTVTFPAGNFAVGDVYTVTVTQNYVPPVVNSGGTYTGTKDRTYIVEVTTGGRLGLAGSTPKITVRSADGSDASGPHSVTVLGAGGSTTTTTTVDPGDLPEYDSATIAIGTLGLTVQIQGYGLRKGDRWTITATAAANTNFRTLVLNHDLSSLIPLNDAATANLEVALYIKKDLELPARHAVTTGEYNFTQSNTELCVMAGIQVYDSSWTDDGVQQPLAIVTDSACPGTNQMYVEYRAWNQTLVGSVRAISDVSDLDAAVSGPLTPDNPLKFALFMALQNNNGQPVRYLGVGNPDDVTTWLAALARIEERLDVYNLVPITRNATVRAAFAAQVQSQSSGEFNRFRAVWFAADDVPTKEIVNESLNGEIVLATTEEDTDTSGTQYTILRGPSGDGHFADVLAGDIVRYQFTVDGWGEATYTEYEVAEVLNDDTLRLVTGTAVAETTPSKVEIYRNLSSTERAEAIALAAGVWNSRRVRYVWPDKFDGSGFTDVDGLHLVAAIASLSSGVLPHQGLTNVTISGVTSVSRTVDEFDRTELDVMAGNGVWLVTQTPTGQIISRHAVTTASTDDVDLREEMITRNLDSISFYLLDRFAPYIGIANAVDKMLDIIEAEFLSGVQFLRSSGETALLGGQLVDATLDDLRRSLEFRDRFLLASTVQLPAPLNGIQIKLLIP